MKCSGSLRSIVYRNLDSRRLGDTTFAPTVILDPPDNCRLSTQEIFGLAIAVYSSPSLDDSITRANALPWAFQASFSPTGSIMP